MRFSLGLSRDRRKRFNGRAKSLELMKGTIFKKVLSNPMFSFIVRKTGPMIRSIFCLLIAQISFAQSYTTTTFAGSPRLLDGHPAKSVPLRYPYGAAQDSSGNVYFADSDDNRIRKVDPQGIISTIAGTGEAGFGGDGDQATKAKLKSPQGIKLDGKGNLYIADYNNNRVRKLVLATGVITTVAGNGNFHYSGDGGKATDAGLDPYDIAVDSSGNLYIAD